MDTIKNIYKYLDFKGISVNKFSQKIGVSNSYFSKQNKNNGSIGSDILNNIVKYYEDINPEWLLTGKGEMLKKENELPVAIRSVNNSGIPLIPYDAIAGFGDMDISNGQLVIEEYYHIPEFKNKADFMVHVRGNSMYPKFSSGDVLACKLIHEVLFFQWHKIYVIESATQGHMVKRIEKASQEENILCVSENEKYAPFEIPKSDIRRIAIVIGCVRME